MNELISLAREAISAHFENKEIKIPRGKFRERRGVFVTLTINNQLRGCIGFIEPIFFLNEAVIKAATAAAFSDPRFTPLTKEEFNKIKIEISILTKPELMKGDYTKQINIGTDGLIIEKGNYKGLLLPQVFTEFNANPEEALEMTCKKAGLEINTWEDSSVKVYKFQVEIIKE